MFVTWVIIASANILPPVQWQAISYTKCWHVVKWTLWTNLCELNTLSPRQNGRRFEDDVFKCIFLNENVWISLKISLKFVPKDPINNIPALVQILAWRRSGDKPLSEPMMVSLLTHICVTRPQWVKHKIKKKKLHMKMFACKIVDQ